MHKFTIYAHYDVMLNSEAYSQLRTQMAEERVHHANEVDELKNLLVDERKKRKEERDEY